MSAALNHYMRSLAAGYSFLKRSGRKTYTAAAAIAAPSSTNLTGSARKYSPMSAKRSASQNSTIPIITANIAQTSTAPAAQSLQSLISSSFLRQTLSQRRYTAVLKSSADITAAKVRSSTAHSARESS